MLELTYVAATSRLDRLGIQERQVLQLIAHGQSDAAIGRQLGLSPLATEEICTQVFDKLGLVPSAYLSRRVLAVLTLRQAPTRAKGARSRDAAH